MSTFKNPVGPQPSRVYWRRRILVGLGLLAVILILVLIFGRPGANADAEPVGNVPVPASTEDTATDTKAAATVEDEEGTGVLEDCDASQVEVVPVTDADGYELGVQPQLSFTIANTGADACQINAGTSTQVFTVTSGEDVIWTSTDCQTDPIDGIVTLEPGEPVPSEAFAWGRVWSDSATCDDEDRQEVVADGATYNLSVEVGGVESEDAKAFLLY